MCRHPSLSVWGFLRPYIEEYDASVFSMPEFSQTLPIPQFMVPPSIDPLSDKNREIPSGQVTAALEKYGLDPERPIITQISRFDRLKDPVGVIQSYRLVKRRYPCQLVLAGGAATDDPEGEEVLREVHEAADDDPDIHVLLLPPFSDLEINALVRGSTIIMQKSVKEGFGLTVTEALWEAPPGHRRLGRRHQAAAPERCHWVSRAFTRGRGQPGDRVARRRIAAGDNRDERS